jgi:CHAD domain-containing protein
MAFRLRRKESVAEGVRRIAREEIDCAVAEIAAREAPLEVIVHESRKHCKKLRGLLRLVGPALEENFASDDAWLRETSQGLSLVRDADVLLQTLDKLHDRFRNDCDLAALVPIRQALVEHRRRVAEEEGDIGARLKEFAAQMHNGRRRIEDWRFDEAGFDALAPGLKQTYRRGRRALKRAYADPAPENFHQWRKHVKYHWYQMRLLGGLWKQEMQVRRDAADYLADLLGDDHDLVVLHHTLSGGDFGIDAASEGVQSLLSFADRRRLELQNTAHSVGRRLYAEKPSQLIQRLHGYWQTWRAKGKSPQKVFDGSVGPSRFPAL